MSRERDEEREAIRKRIDEIKEIENDPDRVDERAESSEIEALLNRLLEIRNEVLAERDLAMADLEKKKAELEKAYARRDELAEYIKAAAEKMKLIETRMEQLRQQERKSLEAAVEDGGLMKDDPRTKGL